MRMAWFILLGVLAASEAPLNAQADTALSAREQAASQPAVQPEQLPAEAAGGDAELPAAEKPLRGPRYFDLRYDEDFSYLEGPAGSYRPDPFDPVKWIRLDEDWTLTLGGEFRAQLESETRRNFGALTPAQDTVLLHRYLLHADLRYRDTIRIFVQGINAMVEDRDFPPRPIDENRFDVHQLFVDVRPLGDATPLTLRVGRQELLYGAQRLISPLDWANNRRRFDGVKLFYRSEKFDIDAFYVRPLINDLSESLNRKPDEYRAEQHFYGVYSTWRPVRDHYVESYVLGLHDTGDLVDANMRPGDLTLITMGARAGGKCDGWDYDGEFAGQFGRFAGDTVQAWMAAVDGGYTFASLPLSPRVGAGFDYGSGDADPTDGQHQTFNQLFPLGHAYLGYADHVARQNIMAGNLNLTFKPAPDCTARVAWYVFWADEVRDALYNAAGVPIRRAAFGGAGHDIGNEVDLTLKFQLDVHQSLLLGWSHIWGNNFIVATGADRDVDLFYVQYGFKF